jgi:hypothetical protein
LKPTARLVPLLGEGHQALGVGQFVGQRLVDVGRDAGFEQPGHDLRVDGRRGVHEGGVEARGEERVEVGVELCRRDAQFPADPGERGRGTGVQVQFDPGQDGEHRQVGLLRDVAESDDADLHGGAPLTLADLGLPGSIR